MKFFVLGFVFNKDGTKVLLVQKERPKWQAGLWNGIGGKIEGAEFPKVAMMRECYEETGCSYTWDHVLTFVCPGGTVFVYRAFSTGNVIAYSQMEDEFLDVYSIDNLPSMIINNLKWMIPVCLSSLQMPLIVQQNTLGNEG